MCSKVGRSDSNVRRKNHEVLNLVAKKCLFSSSTTERYREARSSLAPLSPGLRPTSPRGREVNYRAFPAVCGAAFRSCSRRSLSAARVQLWAALTRRPIGVPLRHQSSVVDVTVSPDGRTILSASMDRTARLWSLQPAALGEVERIVVWGQVATGAKSDDSDVVRVLDPSTWQHHPRRLEELDGSPLVP